LAYVEAATSPHAGESFQCCVQSKERRERRERREERERREKREK
jgi:hypothetical protein